MTTSALVDHNIAYLRQALELVRDLDKAAFSESRPPFFHSGIGDHLRHIVEHYQCFLAGVDGGRVDYDGRQRDVRIASNPEYFSQTTQSLIDGLAVLDGRDGDLAVKLDGSSGEASQDPWSQSTIKRELQYLQAHTVHHYALIAFILRLQGREPDPEFGVAPSTLRHRKAAQTADRG